MIPLRSVPTAGYPRLYFPVAGTTPAPSTFSVVGRLTATDRTAGTLVTDPLAAGSFVIDSGAVGTVSVLPPR